MELTFFSGSDTAALRMANNIIDLRSLRLKNGQIIIQYILYRAIHFHYLSLNNKSCHCCLSDIWQKPPNDLRVPTLQCMGLDSVVVPKNVPKNVPLLASLGYKKLIFLLAVNNSSLKRHLVGSNIFSTVLPNLKKKLFNFTMLEGNSTFH